MKRYDVCLAPKVVGDKPYSYLQSLLILTQQQKNLSIKFVIGLLISINTESEVYDSILVIVDYLAKIVSYKSIKVSIDPLVLAKVIINLDVRYFGLLISIVNTSRPVFILKFQSSLCYFLGIKQKLSITFNLQTNGLTQMQKNAIEIRLRGFINYKQDNQA